MDSFKGAGPLPLMPVVIRSFSLRDASEARLGDEIGV